MLTSLSTKELLKNITDPGISFIDEYAETNAYGLNMPELVMREAYIMKPNIAFLAGWETGRQSEPAFMDLNLQSVRGTSTPEVVIYQYDAVNPMNPNGLLIAYAESSVKPVVSDFDTFTVGSKGMEYTLPVPPEQAEVAMWTLQQTS